MSVHENGAVCDRCGVSVGNGSPITALVVSDFVDGEVRNYHYCRDRLAPDGTEVAGCARLVVTPEMLTDYQVRNPDAALASAADPELTRAREGRARAAEAAEAAPLADVDGAPADPPETPPVAEVDPLAGVSLPPESPGERKGQGQP